MLRFIESVSFCLQLHVPSKVHGYKEQKHAVKEGKKCKNTHHMFHHVSTCKTQRNTENTCEFFSHFLPRTTFSKSLNYSISILAQPIKRTFEQRTGSVLFAQRIEVLFTSFLLLVVRPGAPSSFLLLVAMHFVPTLILQGSSIFRKGFKPSHFHRSICFGLSSCTMPSAACRRGWQKWENCFLSSFSPASPLSCGYCLTWSNKCTKIIGLKHT